MDVIKGLRARGVKVSIGHTSTTLSTAQVHSINRYTQSINTLMILPTAQEAVRNGATMITHLFNAMPPFHHRNPGLVGLLAGTPAVPVPEAGNEGEEEGEVNGGEGGQMVGQMVGGPGAGDVKHVYFGIISDGIHCHPSSIRVAHQAHPVRQVTH
jgi:N-acetylglucosamine-6-phosphate deacetylase